MFGFGVRRRERPRRRGRIVLRLLGLVVVAWVAYEAWTWPDVSALARGDPATTAFVQRYVEKQRRQGRTSDVHLTWVPYGSISPNLKQAVLVGEDFDFFYHHGFDLAEIRKAVEDAWRDHEPPRGASTLTQQLAKNLWLSPSPLPTRKLKEAVLTWQLERYLSKRRIFEVYLNVVEFGPGQYGVENAAQHYFGKPARDLGPEEAAQLAAGLPKPSLWHPGSTSRTYQKRVETLLRRMSKARFPGGEV